MTGKAGAEYFQREGTRQQQRFLAPEHHGRNIRIAPNPHPGSAEAAIRGVAAAWRVAQVSLAAVYLRESDRLP